MFAADVIPVPDQLYVTGVVVVVALALTVVVKQVKVFDVDVVTNGVVVFDTTVTTAEFVQLLTGFVITNV